VEDLIETNNDHLHFINSVLRERIVEHVFIGEVLRRLWQRGVTDVEVLRSEFDAGGYDLVVSYRKIVRHIQLKSVKEKGITAQVKVSLKLAEKPSGCVILIVLDDELKFKSYRWFGGLPGEPLPDLAALKIARYTKANAEGVKLDRPNHRILPRTMFEPIAGLDDLITRLFGGIVPTGSA
jgi:hypothetical protein